MNFDIYKNIAFSQAGVNGIPGGGSGSLVQTLAGNDGIHVGPTGNNINVVGTGDITVTGNPGTSTLTISTSGAVTDSFQTDSGVATPAAGVITFNAISQAGSTVFFSGSGSTVRLNVSDASHNTFIGQQSGNAATVGSYNTGLGYQVMSTAVLSPDNSAFGATALKNLVSGGQNTAVGSTVMQNLQTGDANVGVGVNALFDANGANRNTAIGTAANADCSVGSNNTMVGWQSGRLVTSGSFNSYFGSSAGGNTTFTDSNNIMIGNIGSIGDNNKIIIGTQGGGPGQQNTCFIAGIVGVTTANSQMVTVNSSTGQLGAQAIPQGANAWTVITGASQTMAVNNGYIANRAGNIAFALPATASIGDILRLTGINTALGWTITQAANQQIFASTANTTLGVGGSLSSSATRDSVELVCVVAGASTIWNVISMVGNLTYV